MLLTQQSGILKPFAKLIGYLIEGIYWLLEKIGIPNIGLSIILLTILIYTLMIPLTYKQQKFSKLSAKMNPELQAIQAKYKGKTDQDSMMKMQMETKAIYTKYGVSPSGSCIQLLIQMPILFALYRVIYSIPAYIKSVGNIFGELATKIIEKDNAAFLLDSGEDSISSTVAQFTKNLTDENMHNGVIDVLNRLSTKDMHIIADHYGISDLTYTSNGVTEKILSTVDSNYNIVETGFIDRINTFLGLNISNSPSYALKAQWDLAGDKNWLIIIGVLLIPLLAALTQFINVKLMPQYNNNSNPASEENAMMSSMKTMNSVMPIMSAVFCFTLPVGIGIYWIAGSVVRTIIQIIVNKKIDKIDIKEMIAKNIENDNIRRAKQGLPAQPVNGNSNIKNVDRKPSEIAVNKKAESNKAANIKDSTEYYKNAGNVKEGSLASKAFMVKKYNEKKNDK